MFDVVSIGAATADIFVKSSAFQVDHDQLVLPYSSKNEITQSLICSGGGATNSSVSFSRLGLKSACISQTGSDYLYQYITADLKQDHVANLSTQVNNITTDFSVILVAPDGGRTVLTNRGPTSLQSADIPWNQISQVKWFYITSLEGNLDLLEKLIGFAHEHDIKISLNPGNRELQTPSRLIPLLPYVDFLLLNTTESQMLVGKPVSDPQFWDHLISLKAKISAITNGRNGAYLATSDQKLYSPIINTKPVDETGAGDSFGSATVAALIHHQPLEVALHWGIKNSASVVSALGAKPGLLTLDQINH